MSKQPASTKKLPRWVKWFVAAALLLVAFSSGALALSVHLENNDRFCASCHTHPETTFVERATQQPADLASAHAAESVHCIQCHSGEGKAGRVDALKLGMRDALAFVSRNYTQPAPLTHPIPDENCLKCHGDIGQAQTFENHFHVLLPRWQQARPGQAATCVDCHSAHTTDGRPDAMWVSIEPTQKQCEGCHRIMCD